MWATGDRGHLAGVAVLCRVYIASYARIYNCVWFTGNASWAMGNGLIITYPMPLCGDLKINYMYFCIRSKWDRRSMQTGFSGGRLIVDRETHL